MNFLTAEWKKLSFANYIIDKEVLKDYIPHGTELDLWQGNCYISLVGMMFLNTKILGVKIPFHINFEEVNLRFYVKKFENGRWRRGVVFIKEIVPKSAISFVAKNLYKENYETMRMSHIWKETSNRIHVEYRWGKSNTEHIFSMNAGIDLHEIKENTETEFILENYLGFARVTNQKTHQYSVKHPQWKIYKVEDYNLHVNFGSIYGQPFEFLSKAKPHSVILVEGSEIAIENKKILKS